METQIPVRSDRFLDIVLDDADLLDAEFAAIIEANWGPGRPPLPRPTPLRPDRAPGPAPVPYTCPAGRGPCRAGDDAPARQRSPPDRDGRGPTLLRG